MKLSVLLRDFEYRLAGYCADCEIDRIATETNEAGKNTLFICMRKGLRDGHYGALAAYSKGCRCFLAERGLALPADATVLLCEDAEAAGAALAARLLGDPARALTVYGVLGKAGKTTVAASLAKLLNGGGKRTAAILTEGVWLDNRLERFENTVADGVQLQYLLRRLADGDVTHVVLEISSYMLAHKGANAIPFAALLFTDAADGKDLSDAKTLFAAARPLLILPHRHRDAFAGEHILTYGKDGNCAATACEPFSSKRGFGTRFSLVIDGEKASVSLPVPGDFAVQNALLIAQTAHLAGLAVEEIAKALSASLMWGSLQCVAVVGKRYIYRDAAYSPEALARVLAVLRERTEGKLTVVVGSVGGRAFERRAPLGKTAASLADLVYLTADNPDDEAPLKICEEMAADIDEPWRYVILPDRAAAIRRAVQELRPGDTLLIAGKAREDYQLQNGKREPFDEERLIKETAKQF